MKRPILLPDDFSPPESVVLGPFFLEALHPKHNERDFHAWNGSKDSIIPLLDPLDPWMEAVSSEEVNLSDLKKDYQEFKDRICFRYAILDSSKNSYLGCFYIRPTAAKGFDCRIEYWLKDEAVSFEKEFHSLVKQWLTDFWQFSDLAFPGREMDWNLYHQLEEVNE